MTEQTAATQRSYTNTRLGLRRRFKEAKQLAKRHAADQPGVVRDHLEAMEHARRVIETALGAPLRGKSILEIGPGQQLKQARYFAADNDVLAVDLDVVIVDMNPAALLRALRFNGPVRFLKTMARKAAGFDRRFVAELIRQYPKTRDARPRVLRCDAARTGIAAATFDCAMSYSVFEHLPDPRAVCLEINRLLKPGGVSHHVVHLFSSDSGAHDPRTFTADREGLPYWCHLRADQAHLVASNCYVNALTMAQWKALIADVWPGARVEHLRALEPQAAVALREARAERALAGYSDDELMTNCLQVTWTKPAA